MHGNGRHFLVWRSTTATSWHRKLELASLYVELYRLYGESEAETKPRTAHGRYVLSFAHGARDDLAKNGPKVLRAALQKSPSSPDKGR